jgi:DUF1680 family protein
MLQSTGDARYADVMERALYNGVLSGISLDGARFFYANPLAVHPRAFEHAPGHVSPVRREWFGCACCPPNIARLLASLPSYAYSAGRRRLYVHLYTQSDADFEVGGTPIRIRQKTHYPWRGSVRMEVDPARPVGFALALRLPGWCRKPTMAVNGKRVGLEAVTKKGYAHLKREWRSGDRIELELPMPVERVHADPRVRQDAGRVALQRGPVVYCLEETDNGADLNALVLPPDARLRAIHKRDLLGGVTVIRGRAKRELPNDRGNGLYADARPATKSVPVTAVPYYAWCNREPGEMLVWVREC